jgi:hypothetical protein
MAIRASTGAMKKSPRLTRKQSRPRPSLLLCLVSQRDLRDERGSMTSWPMFVSVAGYSTRARILLAMKRAVRTGVPLRVTSVTSTMPRPVLISTRRPLRLATTSYVRISPPASMTISTRSPRTNPRYPGDESTPPEQAVAEGADCNFLSRRGVIARPARPWSHDVASGCRGERPVRGTLEACGPSTSSP